jgi:uncharacterized membrane protein YcgQ (UPF0703/DUF1980 family)
MLIIRIQSVKYNFFFLNHRIFDLCIFLFNVISFRLFFFKQLSLLIQIIILINNSKLLLLLLLLLLTHSFCLKGLLSLNFISIFRIFSLLPWYVIKISDKYITRIPRIDDLHLWRFSGLKIMSWKWMCFISYIVLAA